MSAVTRITGRAIPIRGDEVDTDRIIPARFLKAITFEGLERHLFEDDRAVRPGHAIDDPRFAGAAVMVVNRNFGCGSSREHAPQAICRRGIQAIVGESFSEIFFGNSVALGLPCVTVSRADAAALMDAIEADPSLELAVDLKQGTIAAGMLRMQATLPAFAREAFLSGGWDATGLLRDRPEDVEAVAARLPYLTDFELA
jgi:3-isopropylmalate/(R)-2-methylmalate dehydratase small subunit